MNMQPTTCDDYQSHMQRRLYIRATLTDLREQGISVSELIEVMRNELQLLTIEADKAEVSAKDLPRPGADFFPTEQTI
jgi:hypothetical protein